LVADINRQLEGSTSYDYHPIVTVNGSVLFRSATGEVWKSDGTPAGTGLAGTGVQIDAYGNGGGVEFKGARYFLGTDSAHGDELWRTDGTPQGTRLILDTFAGPFSGYPRYLTVAGNTLYFIANGNQIWRSDGTTPGTFPIRSIGLNFQDYDFYVPGIQALAASGNRVYMQVNGIHGGELWTADGTYAGTRLVANLYAAGGWGVSSLLGDANGSFYFIASSQNTPSRLWVTNGTAAGTKLVRDDLTVSNHAAALGGKLIFIASDGTTGNELWVTDGTPAGTTPLKDINPNGYGSPLDLVTQGSYVYFTADDGTTGRELWRTDGTADGTIRLADLYPGSASSDVESLTPTTDGLYFTAITPDAGKELWETDGTPEGTVLVADLEPGPGSSFPAWLVSIGDRVFWVSNTTADGSALWVTGPTGPTLLSQVPAKTESSFSSTGATLGGVHYFVANDRDHGYEVWRTDGTDAGTWLLKDIAPGPDFSFATGLRALDGTLYFGAKGGLWASDGTTDGTRLVTNVGVDDLTVLQGKLIFTARTAAAGTELWVSDGTADGTQLVKDIFPGPGSAFSSYPRTFTELNGYLYFVAQDPDYGWEIWRTDGTEVGTTRITDLPAPAVGLSANWRLEQVGDHIVFWGPAGGTQTALLATDGTAGGTVSLGLSQSYIDFLGDRLVLGDKLLLWAKDPTHPNGLWVTDGTPAGTTLVRSGPMRGNLVAAGGLAYFVNWNNEQELWRTDGTPAGTFLLRTFTQPVGTLVPFGNQLYFVGHDLLHGYGLWTTDGTIAGTHLVDDLVAGPYPKFARPTLSRLGGALFLEVRNVVRPGHGEGTLWRSDGTEAGTHPIARGEFTGITELNGVALFTHDDGLTGREFWRYDPITTGADHYTLEDGLRLDVPTATGILANDADGGGQPLSLKLLTKPKNGWLTLRPDGSFIYQPFSRDLSGTETFTYRVDAGSEQSAPVTVSIDVDLVNQAPIPENDVAAGRAGLPVTVRVLANDSDPDNDTLTVASFTQGASGRVTRIGNALIYTPRVAGALTDTFTYTVRDKRGATATATVTVNLTAAAPPKVTAVRLFPGPGTGSVNLLTMADRPLPFQQFSRIEVTFSADVSVSADDLRLIGAQGGSYALSGFSYDAARRTASWLIGGPTTTWADRLTVLIDGSAASGVTNTTGIALGSWAKTVSTLVGDFDGDGVVTTADRAAIKLRYGTVVGAQRLFADLDGNGVVSASDADLVTANLGGRRV
jgi:ELWxxDGT repeat protein